MQPFKMILKTLVSLLLLLGLTTLALEQEEHCGGIQSIVPFQDILSLLDYYSQCSYPTHKMNTSCILSSCPSLKGLCPLSSNEALNSSVSIFSTCLRQSDLICGVNMSRISMIQLAWTTAQLIPGNMANGTIQYNPGTGYIVNLPKATFAVNKTTDENGIITLIIEAIDIIGDGEFNCNFSIPSVSVLSTVKPLPFASNPFSTSSSSLDFLNTPFMHGIYHLNLTSTVSIDLKPQPPTVQTIDFRYNIHSTFNNFVTLGGMNLNEIVTELFNEGMDGFFQDSVVPTVALNFLSTYAALALQGAQEGCS